MSVDVNTPAAGLYKLRAQRRGPFRAVAIIDASERDADGNLMEDQRFVALLNGEEAELERVWPWAARNPISREEYDELLSGADLGEGGNYGEDPDTLTEADLLVAEAAFLTGVGHKIDAVKKATGLLKKLDEERREATEPKRAEIAEIERPYKEAHANVTNARAMLLTDITAAHKGEKLSGQYAVAYEKVTQHVEITNPGVIPREWLAPDLDLIEAALKKGAEIPGAALVRKRQVIVS